MKKKTLEEEIKAGVANEIEYNSYSMSIVKKVLENIQSSSSIFIATVEKMIKQENFNPLQKFYALKLIEAVMENDQSLEFAGELGESALLLHLRNLAEFRKEDPSETRGATLFGSNKQQVHSTNFFLLLLEFFEYWGSVLPEENESTAIFYEFYAELVEIGVTFPQKFRFIAAEKELPSQELNKEINDSRSKSGRSQESKEKPSNLRAEPANQKHDPTAIQINQSNSERSSDHKPQVHHGSLGQAHYREHPETSSQPKEQISKSLPDKSQDSRAAQNQQKQNIPAQNLTSQKTRAANNQLSVREGSAQSQIAGPNKNLRQSEKLARASNVEESKAQRVRHEEEKNDEAYWDEEDDFQDAEEIGDDDREELNSDNLKIEQEPIPHYKSRETREHDTKNKHDARRQLANIQVGKAGSDQEEENFEEHSATQIQKVPTIGYEQLIHNPLRQEIDMISEEQKEKIEPKNNAFAVRLRDNQGIVTEPIYYNTTNISVGGNFQKKQNEARSQADIPVQLNFQRGLDEIRKTVYANAEKASQIEQVKQQTTISERESPNKSDGFKIEQARQPITASEREFPNKADRFLKENEELKKRIQQLEAGLAKAEKLLNQSKNLELQNQALNKENHLLLEKLEQIEREKKYAGDGTEKSSNKALEEAIRKNSELQQRVKAAEIQLTEKSQEIEELNIQLNERDAIIEEMNQTIVALEEDRKEIIEQYNALSKAAEQPITEPEDSANQFDEGYDVQGRQAHHEPVEVVLDKDFLRGVPSQREPGSKKREQTHTAEIRHRFEDDANINPRDLYFRVNLDPEVPAPDPKRFQKSKTDPETSKNVGMLIRKNLYVDLADLTGARSGYLEYDYGPNQQKPPSSYSSRKGSQEMQESSSNLMRESSNMFQESSNLPKEEFLAKSEERELIIGQLVNTEEFIRSFEEYLQSIDEEDNRKQLKVQGLASSFVLYEDNYILINVESSFQYETQSKKNRIAFRMRFKNKTSSPLQNFQMGYGTVEGVKIVAEQGRQTRIIQPLVDEIRTVYAYYESIPQGLPMLSWSFNKNDEIREQWATIPLFIHRFLEFKKIDSSTFRSKWNQWKRLYPSGVFKTEDIALNPMIIVHPHDFRKISDKLVEIPFKNSWKKSKYVKFGGIFNIEFLGAEYILRIFVDRGMTNAVFQIICYPSKETIGLAVINQLAFLLQNI